MNGEPTPLPSSAARQATAREFIAIVFRRKGIVLGLFLVTTATVLVVAFTRPLEFESVGRVLIKRGEQESSLSPSIRIFNWEEELATESQVVKSYAIRVRAQQLLDGQARLGMPKIPVKGDGVGVEVIGQSNVLEIGYADRHPEVAERACDAILQAYVDYRSRSDSRPYPKEFFESELARVEAAIESLSTLRERFAISQNVVDIGEQRANLLNHLQNTEHNRSVAAADLAEERAKLDLMARLKDDPAVDVPVYGSGFLNESAVVELKRDMVKQETRIAQMRERYRQDAPELLDALATLESMRGLLRREVEQRLRLAQTRVQGLQSRVASLDREIARMRAEMATLPAKETTMGALDHELTVLRERYMDLVRDDDQARVNEQTTRRVNVLVLSPASAARPLNTRDYVRLALAPAFSLVVGIGLAFFVDGLDTRMRTAGQLEESLDLPVFATLKERKSG